jgi:hypothetical protein
MKRHEVQRREKDANAIKMHVSLSSKTDDRNSSDSCPGRQADARQQQPSPSCAGSMSPDLMDDSRTLEVLEHPKSMQPPSWTTLSLE